MIATPAGYGAADALLNDISDRMSSPNDRQYINLFRLLAARIQAREDEHEPLPISAPHELLAFLLEKHGLKQSDLSSINDSAWRTGDQQAVGVRVFRTVWGSGRGLARDEMNANLELERNDAMLE